MTLTLLLKSVAGGAGTTVKTGWAAAAAAGYGARAATASRAGCGKAAGVGYGQRPSPPAVQMFTLEAAFTSNPFGTPAWTDISAWLRHASIRRTGRNRRLDRMEASTAAFILDNQDRRFDPTYTAGPYYGNVLPMRRVRFTVTHGSTSYRLFDGYVDTWPLRYDQPNLSTVEVSCTDAFKALRLADLTGDLAQAMSGAQIAEALNQAGWPAGSRLLDTGQSEILALLVEPGQPVNALQRIQDVADAESGVVFADGQGRIVFRDRHTVLKPPYTVAQATLGDDASAGEFLFDQLTVAYDDTLIYNDVRVTAEGGVEQTAVNTASQAVYGRRTLAQTVPVTTDAEAAGRANFILGRYAQPGIRVESVEIRPLDDDLYLAMILNRELGDRVTVKRRPPGGGDPIVQDCHIEGITHDIPEGGGTGWVTVWSLAPADENTYWVIGDAVSGELDATTRLAY